MYKIFRGKVLILMQSLLFITTRSASSLNNSEVLSVGEELWKESIPLHLGSRLYQIQGLKPLTWYEVKISYPASIPASFSIQLKKGDPFSGFNWNRRLLNTEKIIFKTDSLDQLKDQGATYVLVTVEPEGVVAIPNAKERRHIMFNIVCDELLLGIPYQAWWVVVLGVVCLVLAFLVPCFLPSCLLHNGKNQQGITLKDS